MTKAGSLFTFLAGAAAGAALVYLACTDNGREMAKKGKEKALDCADGILEKLEETRKAVKKAVADVETKEETE